MSNQEPNVPTDPLDRATAALRDVTAPPGPPLDLVNETLAALEQAERQTSRRNKMKLIAKYSVAAIFLIAIGIVVMMSQPSQAAFAAVVEKVQQVHSVKFTVTSTFNKPGEAKPVTGHVDMTIVGDRMRQELPGGFVSIIDSKTGQGLILMVPQKTAIRMTSENAPKQMKQQNMLENFRNMSTNAGKPIGRKQVDGRELDGYKIDENGKNMTIWADPKTHLPVRMEATVDMPMVPKSEVVMDNFQWDVPVDESQFALEVPAGYAVQELSINAAKPTEAELIQTLHDLADANAGKFPDTFDYAGVNPIVKNLKSVKKVPATATTPDAAQMQAAMKVVRGLTFMTKTNGEDFHYAGKGVALNEKERPIFWYKPVNSQTYHVIDADLSVHTDVKAEDLPTIESQKLGSGNKMQTDTATPAAIEGLQGK